MKQRSNDVMMGHILSEADLPFSGNSSHETRQNNSQGDKALSNNELGDLVFGACIFAAEAMDKPCPETAVDLAARDKRALLSEKLHALPKLQLIHPLVQAEATQQVALISEQRELAKAIIRSALSLRSKKTRFYWLALN